MNYLKRLEHWGDTHHSKWMDIVRVALGIFLCMKGVEFAQNMSDMMSLMKNMPFGSFMLVLISHFIIAAHIMGGVLITLGMLTRFACLIQIPILLGAIIFMSSSGEL
ncbi:MAG: DoxX family protein, partial [Bacteroidota bacterium]